MKKLDKEIETNVPLTEVSKYNLYNYYICQHCPSIDRCINGCALVNALKEFEESLQRIGES